ncbi:MAG: 5-(carboxyamino)imidazole ribonucleotide synthase [Pseudomonadales bacterium]|nr:5-(carboxyamino)imidazole ribonucleotide synthase [Pseudomonadales bacterium]
MTARLGVIGGGQLGLYLCEAARALGVQVAVLTESADDAASHCADSLVVGELDNAAAVEQFLADCDVVTFDKEAVPKETLAWLVEAQSRGRVKVLPGAETLLMLKDKALQKTWLTQQSLPTLPFHVLSGSVSSLELIGGSFGKAVVQKARCGGYDGRGVQIIPCLESERQLWDVPSIVEPLLANCVEISVITVRDQFGDMQTYPPVGMEFDPQLNSVKTVSLPAAVSPAVGEQAVALAERIVSLLKGVGVFAIEMFVTAGDELLINEISPRVHNSGHLTLDACNVSQFEQHVRAVCGLPLLEIECKTSAAMLNLLYSEDLRVHCPPRPVAEKMKQPGTSVYWYGKAPGMVGRKMGHINAVAPEVEEAVRLAAGALAKLSSGKNRQAA